MILPWITSGTLAMRPGHRLPLRALLAAAWLAAGAACRAADLAAALLGPSPAAADATAGAPDPLAGTARIDPATTGPDAERVLATLLPPRSDSPADWVAPLEPLHSCGEPRKLPRCVPPPPCHPALPPCPFDLVGVDGRPTRGPMYRGPCAPRTGSHDDCCFPRLRRVPERCFDWFYRSR